MNLKRTDGKEELVKIDELNLKDDDVLPIICDICYCMKELSYKVYKERTLDPKFDTIPCDQCFQSLQ